MLSFTKAMFKKVLLLSSHDVRWQLILLYILSVLLVFAGGIIFAMTTNHNLTSETQFTDLALAQAIAQETQSAVQRPRQAVQYLANQPGVLAADPVQMTALFQTVEQTNADYNLVYRLDQDGVMVFHYPAGVRSTVGENFAYRQYFQQAQTSQIPFVSVGRTSPTTDKPVVTVVMPLWDEAGQSLGIVGINLELHALSQTLSNVVLQQKAKPHLNITLIDPQGDILASLEPTLLLQNFEMVFPHLTPSVFPLTTGNRVELDVNGQEHLLSYASVAETDWSVVVSRPTSVAFATLDRFQSGFLWLMVFYLGLGIFSWVILSRQVIKPLQSITAYIQGRQLEPPPRHNPAHPLALYASRSGQIGQLSQSVIDTEQVITARLDELTTLLETSAAVTSSLDVNTVLNTILVQVEHILKVDKSAIAIYDESSQRFTINVSRGLSRDYIERTFLSHSRVRLAWQAVERNEPIHLIDLERDEQPEQVAPGALAEGVRAIAVIPLKTLHAPLAVLAVYKTQPYTFSQREINLLSSFANHAAMALENAALYGQSDIRFKEQTRRLEALVHSLGDGLVLEDLTGSIHYVNRWMSDFTNLPIDAIKRGSIADLINHLYDQAITTKSSEPSHQPELDLPGNELLFAVPHANRIRFLHAEIFQVTDYEQLTIGQGLLLQDITKNYELDRMKSLLISTVSHELRTPLASIKGYASTLLADDVEWDQAEQREFLEIISHESDRLNRLVNDLLDMSRLEAGRLQLAPVPCDLAEVVARAVPQVYPAPHERLRLDLPADLPPIHADPQRLEVVVRNLIENAVKYTEQDTPITISAQVNNGTVIVQVSDQGPGIPGTDHQRIFDPFFRVEDGLTRQPGLGLGLAICQGFIQAQSGKIWLEPQSQGTCIAFSLPVEVGG
ncbi:MAG: GAF domain-containing protein [Anaerolineae bacterium]|nr:GAF domain-containing protein [Anaerolineae bacterium]